MARARLVPGLLTIALAAASARAGELRAHGVVAGRGFLAEGQEPWIEGGFGRLTEGAGSAHETASGVRAQAHLGLDWTPAPVLLVHVHAAARYEPRAGGDRAGLVEAFVQARPDLGTRASLRFRAGLFFPPTSRENVRPLWSSPYTLTASALNTWIGDEVRLAGVESALVLGAAGGKQLHLAGTAFEGADTAGALLAWRGFTLGDRLSTAREVLPLPPLSSLRDGGPFARQRDDGTRPVDELDGRVGWQARARWQDPGRATVQASYFDNRGDRELYRGQYSWDTRYASAGGDLTLGRAVLVAEAARGDTGMGPRGPGVDVRFETAYALLSVGGERRRLSARYDWFRVLDRDRNPEPDQESGSAWTLAALWSPHAHLRLGAELLRVTGMRPAAAFAGADPDAGARRALVEARLIF